MMDKIRTQKEAALYVGCDVRTIRRWEKEAEPRLVKNGDHYDHEDLDEHKRRSSGIRGLFDADILQLREQVKNALVSLAGLRLKINDELDEMEQKLSKAVGQKDRNP